MSFSEEGRQCVPLIYTLSDIKCPSVPFTFQAEVGVQVGISLGILALRLKSVAALDICVSFGGDFRSKCVVAKRSTVVCRGVMSWAVS